jgi:UDP-N-acetylglucosamine 3-dehydrogenase
MIGHIERFNPVVVKLKELIESGELGDVLTISAERVGPYSPRIRDVGIIIDLAVHDIDTMSYLYDERGSEVYAIAGNSFHKSEDYASILIRFGKNRAGMVNTNWLTPKKIRILTAVGTQGVASLNYLDQTLELWKKEKVKRIEVRKREPLKNELDSFINCIIEDKNPHPSGEDGKYVLSVAIAAIRSYKECRAIDLTGFY